LSPHGTRRPLIVAHRGASADEPENTLRAFLRAIDVGADYIELDVQATLDGELVLVHDPFRATFDELRSANPDVATLDEVVQTCSGRIGLAPELKHPHRHRRHRLIERALSALRAVPVTQLLVLSFEPAALREVHRLWPDVRTMQHLARVSLSDARAYSWGVGFEDAAATPPRLAAARTAGLATGVYTVNEPERMRELADLEVDLVFTDRPDLALATLD
jgi:glycerophosphoryl diester phosphodiesterase